MTVAELPLEQQDSDRSVRVSYVRAAYLAPYVDNPAVIAVHVIAAIDGRDVEVAGHVALPHAHIGARAWDAFQAWLAHFHDTHAEFTVGDVVLRWNEKFDATDGDATERPSAVGLSAMRVALHGVVMAERGVEEGVVAADGDREAGSWRRCDLQEFYNNVMSRMRSYVCVPGPPDSSRGGPANTYATDAYIRMLPRKATVAHLFEREALRRGMDLTHFSNGTFVVRASTSVSFMWGRPPLPDSTPTRVSGAELDPLVAGLETGMSPSHGHDDSRYSVVVVDNEVVAAVVRHPVAVEGTGEHTVLDLIEHKNRLRTLNPALRKHVIELTPRLLSHLSDMGLTLASVPPAGRRLALAGAAPKVFETSSVMDEMHPSIAALAVRAVSAVPGMRFATVNLNLDDHRMPASEQSGLIGGINAHADYGLVQFPMGGIPADAVGAVFRSCCKERGLEQDTTPRDNLSLRLDIKGVPSGTRYQRWLWRRATRLGLSGRVMRTGSGMRVDVHGPAGPVAALVYRAGRGVPQLRPTSVRVTHRSHGAYTGFKVRRRKLARLKKVLRRARRASQRLNVFLVR